MELTGDQKEQLRRYITALHQLFLRNEPKCSLVSIECSRNDKTKIIEINVGTSRKSTGRYSDNADVVRFQAQEDYILNQLYDYVMNRYQNLDESERYSKTISKFYILANVKNNTINICSPGMTVGKISDHRIYPELNIK
jgi:hypothetical protein